MSGGTGADGSTTSGPIAATDSDTFTLHAGSGCGGTALASVSVAGISATYLTASRNPVANSTTTTIRWNTGDGTTGQVWASVDGAPEFLFAQSYTGSQDATWIQPGHVYTFRLYAGLLKLTLLKTITVTGFNFPSISASPNPVTSGTSTTITWDTGDGSTGQVWVSVNDQPEVLLVQGPSGSITPSWIQPGAKYIFTLYAGTTHTNKLSWVIVTHS